MLGGSVTDLSFFARAGRGRTARFPYRCPHALWLLLKLVAVAAAAAVHLPPPHLRQQLHRQRR